MLTLLAEAETGIRRTIVAGFETTPRSAQALFWRPRRDHRGFHAALETSKGAEGDGKLHTRKNEHEKNHQHDDMSQGRERRGGHARVDRRGRSSSWSVRGKIVESSRVPSPMNDRPLHGDGRRA